MQNMNHDTLKHILLLSRVVFFFFLMKQNISMWHCGRAAENLRADLPILWWIAISTNIVSKNVHKCSLIFDSCPLQTKFSLLLQPLEFTAVHEKNRHVIRQRLHLLAVHNYDQKQEFEEVKLNALYNIHSLMTYEKPKKTYLIHS